MLIKQLKQLLKSQLLIILGLVLLGPITFAQTPDNSPSHTKEITEDHDTKNLDKLLHDYNVDQEKVLKDAEKLINGNDTSQVIESHGEIKEIKNVDTSLEDDLKEIEVIHTKNGKLPFDVNKFKKNSDSTKIKKVKYSEAMRVALGPLQDMSEGDLLNLLVQNTKGSSAQQYIEYFPKFTIFTVRLIRDKNALPRLASMIDDQERFIRYISAMLMTIVFGFLLKRFMKKDGRTIGVAVGLWFLRFFVINSLRVGVLFYFFSDEITPTLKIAMKTFF